MTVDAGGQLVILGDTEIGDLNVQGTIIIGAGNSLVVGNTFTLGSTGVIVVDQPSPGQPGPITIRGTFILNGGSLVVNVLFSIFSAPQSRETAMYAERQSIVASPVEAVGAVTPVPAGSTVVTIPVVTYMDREGALDNVTTVITSGSQCDVFSDAPVAVYGSTTLSVVTNVSPDPTVDGCAVPGGGLSTGAIVGIAVGGVIGAVLIFALLLMFLRRKELARKATLFKTAIANRERDTANVTRPS